MRVTPGSEAMIWPFLLSREGERERGRKIVFINMALGYSLFSHSFLSLSLNMFHYLPTHTKHINKTAH